MCACVHVHTGQKGASDAEVTGDCERTAMSAGNRTLLCFALLFLTQQAPLATTHASAPLLSIFNSLSSRHADTKGSGPHPRVFKDVVKMQLFY